MYLFSRYIKGKHAKFVGKHPWRCIMHLGPFRTGETWVQTKIILIASRCQRPLSGRWLFCQEKKFFFFILIFFFFFFFFFFFYLKILLGTGKAAFHLLPVN